MGYHDEIDRLAVGNYSCLYCGVQMGAWCRTKSGQRATQLHSSRTTPLHQAFAAGYMEDERYYVESLRRRADMLRSRMLTHGVDEQGIEEILAGVMDKRWY